jgi:hypothetical protein
MEKTISLPFPRKVQLNFNNQIFEKYLQFLLFKKNCAKTTIYYLRGNGDNDHFQSFAGFWYPADKICISLVYIIGTNIETKRKNAGRAYTGLNLVIFIEEHVHL